MRSAEPPAISGPSQTGSAQAPGPLPGILGQLSAGSAQPPAVSVQLPGISALLPAGVLPAGVMPRPEVSGRPPRDAVAPPVSPRAASIAGQVVPPPVEGPQRYFIPSPEQWENARTIVGVVRAHRLPMYTAVIALATAIQESSLRNLTEAVDYDSLGLFQQRPSAGWGDPNQLTDPVFAAGAFLDALLSRVPDYAAVPLWQAAQRTQASAFPELYAQWQDQAMEMVAQISAE